MIPTKYQIDSIFHSVADEHVAAELNKQAREMFAVAEKSEHFRAVVTQFIAASMQSLTLGGLMPKGPAMACCVMFLLGQRSVSGQIPEPPLDQEFIDKMLKEMEGKWDEEKGK